MKCPVCLSSATAPSLTGTDFFFRTTSQTFTLDLCRTCRSLFLDPMPTAEELTQFYPTQYWWSSSTPGLLKRLERVYRKFVLRDHISFITTAARSQNGLKLLDVGCGGGSLIGLLKDRGFRVKGVDFSADAAKVANLENGVEVIVGSLEDARFPAGSFDIVTLFHVMEHVTRPREVLEEVSRILRPKGTVILQVPNADSWQFKLFKTRWYGLDIPRHVIDYPKDAILQLLKDSGFSPKRIRHFNLRDNAPALASTLFPSLDPVSRAVRQRHEENSESGALAWMRHLTYLMFVLLALPLAILEAAAGHGATIMIEAEKA